MNWFKKLFKKDEPKIEPGPMWVHLSKFKKAEREIIKLKGQIEELKKTNTTLLPLKKKGSGWPKGKPRGPRKSKSQILTELLSKK